MAYRLVEGQLLMSTVLADAAQAVSALATLDVVDEGRIGVIGHSLGGNTTLFHAALDERVRFACASGAACTYRRKMVSGTGIELAEVITGIRQVADIDDIAGLVAPRPLLLLSASEDRYGRRRAGLFAGRRSKSQPPLGYSLPGLSLPGRAATFGAWLPGDRTRPSPQHHLAGSLACRAELRTAGGSLSGARSRRCWP